MATKDLSQAMEQHFMFDNSLSPQYGGKSDNHLDKQIPFAKKKHFGSLKNRKSLNFVNDDSKFFGQGTFTKGKKQGA